MTERTEKKQAEFDFKICRATPHHLKYVVELDERTTGKSKFDYWQDIFERYGARRIDQRFFLVAEAPNDGGSGILGMIVGEVRGWEFGSEPCGWIFAISVEPDRRQQGIGEALFKAMCEEFRNVGIEKVRTMVRRQNTLQMSFFRGEGMMAGPFIQLEKKLNDG